MNIFRDHCLLKCLGDDTNSLFCIEWKDYELLFCRYSDGNKTSLPKDKTSMYDMKMQTGHGRICNVWKTDVFFK